MPFSTIRSTDTGWGGGIVLYPCPWERWTRAKMCHFIIVDESTMMDGFNTPNAPSSKDPTRARAHTHAHAHAHAHAPPSCNPRPATCTVWQTRYLAMLQCQSDQHVTYCHICAEGRRFQALGHVIFILHAHKQNYPQSRIEERVVPLEEETFFKMLRNKINSKSFNTKKYWLLERILFCDHVVLSYNNWWLS